MRTFVLTEAQFQSLHDILTELHLSRHADLVICSYTETRHQLIAQIECISDILTALQVHDDE